MFTRRLKSTAATLRGITLIEVLVAIALLVLVFLFVAENMIASSWAESKAAQRTANISSANYLLAILHGDPTLWSKYPDTPKDACGNSMTPVDDSGPPGGTWHAPPACNLAPQVLQGVQYQWMQTTPNLDASEVTIWVQSTIGGKVDRYELHSFTHQTPTFKTLQTPPPSPSIVPSTPPPSTPPPSPHSPTPSPSPTSPPPSTPPPTATPIGV
jgi:type II secretory pathway pseudopilin PulG